jgi:putative tricarboxylic transport membrane protein
LKRDEAAIGAILFLFGGVTSVLSLGMPIGGFRMAGTGLFPLCLGILLMVLAGLFLLKLFYQERKRTEKKEQAAGIPASTRQIILFLGVMVLATLLFNRFGYPLVSFLLMVALLRVLGMKRWAFNLFLSFMTATASYFLFVQWLRIPLPKGWLGI